MAAAKKKASIFSAPCFASHACCKMNAYLGALSTLFTADIGEYGIDAGRALPQLAASEPWWKSITNTFMGQEAQSQPKGSGPPRPKSLRMYNFGSPRVGNSVFSKRFDSLLEDGRVQHAYRIVNGDCQVPLSDRANPKLGKWVSNQRMFYRNVKIGKKGQLCW